MNGEMVEYIFCLRIATSVPVSINTHKQAKPFLIFSNDFSLPNICHSNPNCQCSVMPKFVTRRTTLTHDWTPFLEVVVNHHGVKLYPCMQS